MPLTAGIDAAISNGVVLEVSGKSMEGSYPHWTVTMSVGSSRDTTYKPYLIVTAEDSIPTSQPISPKSEYISADVDNVFSWSYANDSGGVQKAYSLQYSTDGGASWTALASATSAAQQHVVPAGTLSVGGTILWRVRVTSQYDVVGAWSDPATVIVRAAPSVSITSITTTPRPTIAWQAAGQQAYHVIVAGVFDSGVKFGATKSYKIPVYLDDGAATIQLQVQNSFGLWSDWDVRQVTIANTPGNAITLGVVATHDAALSWVTTGNYARYYIYRDGGLIGSTTTKSYTDSLAIGTHGYTVRGAATDGVNYTASNAVQVNLKTDYPMITDADAINWMSLRLSAETVSQVAVDHKQDIAYQHYSGKRLPIAETSGNIEQTLSFTTAFMDTADYNALRALIGKTVCYKDGRGNLIVGVIDSLHGNRFARHYACSTTIRAVELEAVSYD